MSRRRLGAASILLVQLVITAWFGYLGLGAPMDNRIERFAVSSHQGEADYEIFTSHFQRDELVLVTISFQTNAYHNDTAETIFDTLAALPGIVRHISYADFQAEDGSAPPLPFPFQQGTLATAIFSIAPGDDRDGQLADLMTAAETMAGAHSAVQNIQVAGEPVVNTFLNRGAEEVKQRFFPLLTVVTLVLLGALFRSIGVLLVTALSVGSSLAMTTGLIAWSGNPLNLITTLIPALVFVLAVAMQVHVLLAAAVQGNLAAGVREKIIPNLLVAGTTSIGFASLMTSHVAPIAVMGKFMAIGVWVIFVWTHLTHFGLSVLINLRVTPPRLTALTNLFNSQWYLSLISRKIWLLVPLIIIPSGVYALLHNPMESNGLNYFGPDHPIRVRTAFLQEQVTGGSQLELLVQRTGAAPEDGDSFFPGEASIDPLETALLAMPHVRHLFSIYQFAKVAEAAEDDLELSETLLNPFLSPDYYRIQLLVDSLDRPSYLKLKQGIEQAVAASALEEPVILTGTLARVIEIQEYLLASLFQGLLLTIAAVVLLLFFLLGKGRQFLVIFLPNLFPLGMMALAMPLLDIETTIATVMVFSIAFGIAVDDTIHLLFTFLKRKEMPQTRWQFTLHQDARAIFMTSVVLSMGFLVLTTSSFIPTQDFGLLLCIGMMSAYIGDVVFLPMLLVGKTNEARE